MDGVTRHGRGVTTVFDLIGSKENDLTAALGFTLSRSANLLAAVLMRILPDQSRPHEVRAAIGMEVRGAAGRTDLEIALPGALIVLEAKRDWLLPGTAQLASYTPRIHAHGGGVLVTLSQATESLAAHVLPVEVDGVPVVHLSWRSILDDLASLRGASFGHERLWLDQFAKYLTGVVRMRSVADSWVYCVVVNGARPGRGGALTFRQYVTDQHVYFHPYGVSGWPTDPPNFMAFRWANSVQRIHRVMRAEVVPTLLDRWADIPATEDTLRPHAVYQLGPRLPPESPIPSGTTYRASRFWVMLDQLQSSSTVAHAVAQSKQLARLRA